MASQGITTVDPSGSKRSRVLEVLLDPQYDHVSNRQLARLIMVDEWMLRKYRKQMGKGSLFRRGRPPRDPGAGASEKKQPPGVKKPVPVPAGKPKPTARPAKPKRKPTGKKPAVKKPVGKGKAKSRRK